MDVDAMKIGVQIRKVMVFSIRTCYRSVCNHPFLVGFVCFLIFLYRSSPFVFSLLVSSSPILVCTAVLLGTLLSFGQPNIPEIEKEEKVTTHEIASLKTGVVDDTTVVERDENERFTTIERYVGKRRDIVENDLDESILVGNRGSEIKEDGGLVDCALLIDANSREIQLEKQVIEGVGREFNDLELENKREVHEEPRIERKFNDGEAVHNMYSEDKSPGELFDACKEDQLDSAPDSYWKRVGEDSGEDDGPNVDESLDSDSDGAESSSPDASMFDFMPMLDELHPLLGAEAPQPACINDGSDAGYGRLRKRNDDSVDSDSDSDSEEDNDNQGEGGEAEDDNDGDEEEEGEATKEGKEDDSKSAIKWTEDDEKNLMDLGTLELERNQRLESLIARRRARKNMRLMTDRNLIDLESSDIPLSIPSIATTRRNPFELPDDIYDDMAIPGSAPSILLPRRNPFDLPYDSNEEKPDLKGDSFQQEFSISPHKELVYRRNETFSVRPSIFGGSRQDFKLRPYFVPERFSSEEGTIYLSLQSQLSEVSESKASSVPDTESVNSAADEEDKKSHEQIPEQFSSEGMDNTTFQRQISEVSESKVSSVPDTESRSSAVDEEDKKLNELDVLQDTQVISNTDHGAALVESGSKSSGEDDSVDTEQAENRDVHHDEVEITLRGRENNHEEEPSSSGTDGMSTPKELSANEIHLKTEAVEHSSGSSFSSFLEVDEKIPDMRMEGSTALELKANIISKSVVSTQTLPEEPKFHFTCNTMEHKEPVYDSNPQEIERFFSFVSISSDTQLEISEMIPAVLLGSADKESEVHSENRQKDSSDLEELHAAPSQVSVVDENESMFKEGTFMETCELDVKEVGSAGVDPNFDKEKGSILSLLSSGIGPLEEYTVYKGERFHFMNNQVVSSAHDSEVLGRVRHNEDEKLDSVAPTYQITSADSSLCAREGEVPSVVVQNVLVHPSVSTSETEHLEDQTNDEVGPIELEQDEVHLSSSSDKQLVGEHMTDSNSHIQHDADEVPSTNLAADIHVDCHQGVGEEQHPPLLTEQVPMVQLSSSSSEVGRVLQHSSDKEEARQHEEDQDQTSSRDIDSGLYQDTDAKVVSADFSYEDGPSREKSPSALEKRLSWSDNLPSFDDHDESKEAPIILMESTKEVNITNNANVSEDHDHKEKTSENSSSLTSNSTILFESPESMSTGSEEASVINSGNLIEVHDYEHKTLGNSTALTSDSCPTAPFESPEDKSPGGKDVKDEIFDKAAYGNSGCVIEHLSSSVEAYDPHVNEENVDEAADDIKEIDEGLLSELDTVGDFSIKEVIGESLHMELTPEDANAPSIELTPNCLIPTKTDLELPLVEVKSIQDIELAFRRLHEGVDVEEVILPSMLENQVVAGGSIVLGDIISDLPIVEARSVEDICAVFKQVSQSNPAEPLKSLESNEQIAEVETKEVVSTGQIESSDGQAGVKENTVAAAAYKSKHVSEETSETSSPRTPDGKKENIAKSRSSSSSSSSSSSGNSKSENENPERT